ncbi:MAG TPA: GTPase [Candidatus Deferrimicrobium sp.]|nr:GTPase [Candidatus Deferrimicrobium sp.]
MPVNLSPEAVAARQKYMEANTLEEQITTLREYIAAVPKHKGTENLLYTLKKRLSKLQYEQDKRIEKAKKGRSTAVSPFSIKKEGAGQIVIIGMANSGKSSLLKALTTIDVEIADYPFTTQLPQIGMFKYENVLIQIIELPAIFQDMNVKEGSGRQILSAIRNADVVVILLDLSSDPLAQMELILTELASANIRLNIPKLPVNITKTGSGGIVVVFHGERIESNRKDIVDLLMDRKIHNAIVKISDNCRLDDVIDALNHKIANKKAIIVANKGDIEGSKENFRELAKHYAKRFQILPVSLTKNAGILLLMQELYKQLEVIRVYTKEPGKDPSPKPIVLPRGAVVEDVATRLHNKFLNNFKYAKITHSDTNKAVTKKQVGLNYELEDGDIIQFFL